MNRRKSEKALDALIFNDGLFEEVFGEKGVALYNSEYEYKKGLLKTVYGFTDVDEVFGYLIDKEKMVSMTQILYGNKGNESVLNSEQESFLEKLFPSNNV